MSADNGRMPHSADIEKLLVDHAQRRLSKRKWWQTTWGRVTIGGGALTLVAATTVAGVVLLDSQPVSDTATVHCLENVSRNLDGPLSGAAVSLAAPDGVLPIDDAVAICEQMWASGRFTSDDPLNPSPAPDAVPESFTTCVTENGEAAVVPGRAECSVLKLHPYRP